MWLASGSNRVIRGGSWVGVPQNARVAARSRDDPGSRVNYLGLRFMRRVYMSFWIVSRPSRVNRGGSWLVAPQYAWVALRDYDGPGFRYDSLGVRLVRRVS